MIQTMWELGPLTSCAVENLQSTKLVVHIYCKNSMYNWIHTVKGSIVYLCRERTHSQCSYVKDHKNTKVEEVFIIQ